jgi:NAD(P)H-quinone oxidoreductase subunit 5
MVTNSIGALFLPDSLSVLMLGLVFTVIFIVGSYSSRYLRGDSRYKHFFTVLPILVGSTVVMVTTDNLLLLLLSWTLNNLLLVRLMIHKEQWRAARASGQLAAKTFAFGSLFVGIAFTCFFLSTGTLSIHLITRVTGLDDYVQAGLVFLLIGAMMQSGIWPFHKWVISSLNSPTPVSALMHAGLINGGGFLLARFAPLYLKSSGLLTIMFIAGIGTAMLGTFWKLIQNDVKRMLACSTMAQMGFMLAQCGLGLFSSALVHLFWHGMFKANLFLGAASAAKEAPHEQNVAPSLTSFGLALIIALFGTSVFILVSHPGVPEANSRLVLFAVVFMAQTQLVVPILNKNLLVSTIKGLLAACLVASVHGASILGIEVLLAPLGISQPQPLNLVHAAGISVLAVSWIWMIFGRALFTCEVPSARVLKLYVQGLNGSQPHPTTVTVHRNYYSI